MLSDNETILPEILKQLRADYCYSKSVSQESKIIVSYLSEDVMEHYYLTKDLIAAYKMWLIHEERAQATQEKYGRVAEDFGRWLKGRAVTREIITEWKAELLSQGYAPSTINTRLAALNRLFEFVGWTECCSKYLKVQRRMFRDSSRELTQQEYIRLVRAARDCGNEKLSLLMETICSTGIRVSEVKYITVESIRAGKAEIRMKGKIRTILLASKLSRKLLKYAKKQQIASGAVFCTESGKPMSRYQIWDAMKKICRCAGVDAGKVYPHNLRHLFAVVYYKVYRDISKLADILGHSSIETTRIYLLTSGTEHRQQIERLGLIS